MEAVEKQCSEGDAADAVGLSSAEGLSLLTISDNFKLVGVATGGANCLSGVAILV